MNVPPGARRPSRLTHRPDVESFYHLADPSLAGKSCQGTACFVARHLRPECWKEAGAQTPRVYCLGKCFAAPAASADEPRPAVEIHSRQGIVLSRLAEGGASSLTEFTRRGGYRSLERVIAQPREQVIGEIEASGLRGRGGAGFPVGRKWRAASLSPSPEKFIVANADEGDAGAYIDRFLMEDDPHALIEGMAIAARVVGANKGWIYVRSEYPKAHDTLQRALGEARSAGLLGERVLQSDFSFDIEVHPGRGSYVCGEETALLNSLQGRRPVVMPRPPYATEHGLFGQPTVMNNVETLVNIPWIVAHGGTAYRVLGFSQSRGTKVISLNSLFRRPGLYEVEFGITVRRIVEELGGGLRDGATLKGLLIGGPLAGIIPPHLLDTPFGFEELHSIGASVGHGGVVAFDEHTSIPELVHHVFSFGAYESCGQCTPCRLGNRRVEAIFQRALTSGLDSNDEDAEWRAIVSALKWTSLCGLGTGLGEFAESILRHYRKELEPCFR